MKKYSLLLIVAMVGNTYLMAQIGINTDGSEPDPAAMLDIKSHDRGFLPPRLTGSEKNSIANPPEGLFIYNTSTKSLEFYNGSNWIRPGDDFDCGTDQVTDADANVYNTVQIGPHCWMAENLNTGMAISGSSPQTDNSVVEKYCYNNTSSNCETYGGLYQWDEVMQYGTDEGAQGICPTGWHIPSDAEWCLMAMTVDPTVNCASQGSFTGTDVGDKLKSNTGWDGVASGNSGFETLPAGWNLSYSFCCLGDYTFFWTSTQTPEFAMEWELHDGNSKVARDAYTKTEGQSVRCIKD